MPEEDLGFSEGRSKYIDVQSRGLEVQPPEAMGCLLLIHQNHL